MTRPDTSAGGPPSRGLLRSVGHALWHLSTPPSFQTVAPTVRGVRYLESRRRGIAPKADIYLPTAASAGRSLLIVHGGGFVIGHRAMKPVQYLVQHLVRLGVAVCSIDYRMVFRGGRLDEAVEDVVQATLWWHAEAGRRGLDTLGCSMLGISAGGALMLLAAGDPRVISSVPLHGLVSVFGLYDFSHLSGNIGALLPRQVLRTADRAEWARRSPMSAALHPAPLLLVHGTEDGLVPVEQADRMLQMRSSAGRVTQSLIIDGEPHAFLNWPGPAAERTLEAVGRFVTSARKAEAAA